MKTFYVKKMTLKKLTYFNLIYGIIWLFQVVKSIGPMGIGGQLTAIGLMLIIWHNWNSLKIISGQRTRLSKFSFALGLIIILFAVLMIADSVQRIIRIGEFDDMVGALLFLVGIKFIFATTIMVQVIWAIKKYWRAGSSSNITI